MTQGNNLNPCSLKQQQLGRNAFATALRKLHCFEAALLCYASGIFFLKKKLSLKLIVRNLHNCVPGQKGSLSLSQIFNVIKVHSDAQKYAQSKTFWRLFSWFDLFSIVNFRSVPCLPSWRGKSQKLSCKDLHRAGALV